MSARPNRPANVALMDVPLDCFTTATLVSYLVEESLAGQGGYVVTPNLDNMRLMASDRSVKERALSADIRVADGMPLVWASRIQRTPLPGRVPGSDLVLELAPAMTDASRSLFLLGGEPGVAERAASALLAHYPGLRLVGTHCPPFGFEANPEAMEQMTAAVLAAKPDFIYVGLPFPKASLLVPTLREVLPHAWFLGVGISLSFIAGDVDRAPTWMRACGLEWLHRLVQEPQRLGRRYLIECLPFSVRLMISAAGSRYKLSNPASAPSHPASPDTSTKSRASRPTEERP